MRYAAETVGERGGAIPDQLVELRGSARRQSWYFVRPYQSQISPRIYRKGGNERTDNNRMPIVGY